MCLFAFLAGMLAMPGANSRAATPVLSATATRPLSAFTPEHRPEIRFAWKGDEPGRGFIRVECFDLLSEKTTVDYVPAVTEADGAGGEGYSPMVAYGIYRLDCRLVKKRDAPLVPGTGEARVTFAYAPAIDPAKLPVEWPLGAHVTADDPPLPGFKWYRYFSSWAEDNPAKGQYEWGKLDTVFACVRDIGGKLIIANDTTPAWTAPSRPVTRPWVKSATAYPPDDMKDFRAYLDALLRRYDDKAGTVGALEVWNEANTHDRWMGTPGQMVELARIFREEAAASGQRVHRAAPALVVGISVSSGHAQDYVRDLVHAGILSYLDVVSGHWYEEMLAYDRATPINSLPMHVDLLAKPMQDAGRRLPIWNSESGISSVKRENGRIVPQDELNRRAAASPSFDAKQPWLVDREHWRDLGERRAAASFVAGTAMLMGLGVEKTFVYSMRDQGWILDGAPSLAWVALAEFGQQLSAVDFRHVVPVKAELTGGDSANRVLAYRFGSLGKPGVIVAWCYQLDTTVGRPKIWQPWLSPQTVRLSTTAREVEVGDLYGRTKKRMSPADGSVIFPVGEEPVYIRELP